MGYLVQDETGLLVGCVDLQVGADSTVVELHIHADPQCTAISVSVYSEVLRERVYLGESVQRMTIPAEIPRLRLRVLRLGAVTLLEARSQDVPCLCLLSCFRPFCGVM